MTGRARHVTRRALAQLRAPLTESVSGLHVLIGAAFVVVVGATVLASYGANKGLPVVPSYRISVDVPDAQELVAADQVRVGGARVGVIKSVRAIPGRGDRPPFARIELALDTDLRPLPRDSEIQVRPGSILGGKYLSLVRGRSPGGIPDGGHLPLRQARDVTDLDEAFRIFDTETTAGLRGTVGELGVAFAGRGAALNETLASARRLAPPAQRVLGTLAAPGTDLDGLIRGAAATTGALAPVSGELGSLVDHGATTLAALDAAGDSLGESIEQLPPTEISGTVALQRLLPVLDDAAVAASTLRPATRLLAATTEHFADALEAGTQTMRRRTRGLLDPLQGSFGRLSRDPAMAGMVRVLTATIGSLQPTLRFLNPAQTVCNTFGLFFRNVPSAFSEGDSTGAWMRMSPILGTDQMFQSASPDPDLHLNFYPNQNEAECEAGNERYTPGRRIGNPPGNQGTAAPLTSPPAEARR